MVPLGATSLIRNEMFRHCCFQLCSLLETTVSFIPNLQHSRALYPCGSVAEVAVQPHSQPHTCALSKHVCYNFGRQYCTASNYISLIWISELRFDGVVGYRICLTHRRSPVRTRVEPFFFLSSHSDDDPSAPFHYILPCDSTST